MSNKPFEEMQLISNTLKGLCADSVLNARSGHIGLPLGCSDALTYLFFKEMKFYSQEPTWVNRDRFILSAGHGSILLYSLLYLAGYDISLDDLKNFRKLDSKTPGHPEYSLNEGIECTTGPLGQGLAHAVGIALGQRVLEAKLQAEDKALVNHNTYVLAGDGCLMEGVTSEASSLAGHLKLNKLIVIYDNNKITIDGQTDISFSEDVSKRYRAYGWNVLAAHGHDFSSLENAFAKANEFSRKEIGESGPTLIIMDTIAGVGLKKWQGKNKVHGNPYDEEDVLELKRSLNLDETPFHVSDEVFDICEEYMGRSLEDYDIWLKHIHSAMSLAKKSSHHEYGNFLKSLYKNKKEIQNTIKFSDLASLSLDKATRQSSGEALNLIAEMDKNLYGGSADLAGSNSSVIHSSPYLEAKNFNGRNIHFGVREHAMAAISNGMNLHSILRSYCATFLVFSDYMRPSIRLSALMSLPTIYIFTHDSFYVGEDGPTHQPIEQLTSFRCMPNINTFRPADSVETFATWKVAYEDQSKPSLLFLTRQKVKNLDVILEVKRSFNDVVEGFREGAYLIKDFSNNKTSHKLTILSSGSELELSILATNSYLSRFNDTDIRIISITNFNKLYLNDKLREKLFNDQSKYLVIEAAYSFGFSDIVKSPCHYVSMTSFGKSAPYKDIAKDFSFTEEDIVKKIKEIL